MKKENFPLEKCRNEFASNPSYIFVRGEKIQLLIPILVEVVKQKFFQLCEVKEIRLKWP